MSATTPDHPSPARSLPRPFHQRVSRSNIHFLTRIPQGPGPVGRRRNAWRRRPLTSAVSPRLLRRRHHPPHAVAAAAGVRCPRPPPRPPVATALPPPSPTPHIVPPLARHPQVVLYRRGAPVTPRVAAGDHLRRGSGGGGGAPPAAAGDGSGRRRWYIILIS